MRKLKKCGHQYSFNLFATVMLLAAISAFIAQPVRAQDCVNPASPEFDDVVCGTKSGDSAAQKEIGGQFELGDVFAAIGSGQVAWFEPDGTLVGTLNTVLGGFTTGMAFDEDGKLYVTNFSSSSVSVFDTDGTSLGTFGSGYTSSTESIVFDLAGDAYVGAADGDREIRKFAAGGSSLGQFDVATESRGSDWIDLAADQCTMYYTSEGSDVLRYDVCTNTQLSNFADDVLTGGAAYALRLLPGGGLLVANTADIKRLNASGAVVQTYDVTGVDGWFALNLDPDGETFWSGSLTTEDFYRFDIDTGNLLTGPIASGGDLFGLAVFGEITEATCDMPTLANANDILDNTAQTISNTVLDTDGVAELEFTSLSNASVLSVTSPDGDFTSSAGGTVWTAPTTPGPTQATYTLQATADNGSYFVVATDDCPDKNIVDFDPPYEFESYQELSFELKGVYPNPTRGAATLSFSLDEQAPISLAVYDVIGRKVATLVEDTRTAGVHEITWNGQSDNGVSLSSGVYLVRLQLGSRVMTRHLALVR